MTIYPSFQMKRVLILDANQRSALSTTRSLGNRGVPVITADESASSLAGCSRFSDHYFLYPSPQTEPEAFVAAVADVAKKQNIHVILPMTELTSTLLLQNQQAFPGITLPFSDLETIDVLSNKCTLMRLAESLHIPTPQTWYVDDPTAIPFDLYNIPYPAVLKPGKSWLTEGDKSIHTSVRFPENSLAARDIIKSDPAFRTHPFMVQELVSGSGQGLFALYDKGVPIAFFSHRRLREKPPWGGVSVLSESIAIDPVLLNHARALLDAVSWHGVAMVEFKVSENGTPYLMEVNTRFWGSLQLAIDAGVDFPWLLYQVACGEHPATVDHYQTGNRLRWLLGDLDSLYLSLRNRKSSVGEKLSILKRFLTPSPFKTRHEVNRWGDMGPFWWELQQYARDILK